MKFIIWITIIIILSNLPENSINAANLYPGPDDPKTVVAAEDSFKNLGKDRGAIIINYKTLDIIGLEGIISSRSINVDDALKDLNAQVVGTEIQISLSGDVLFDFDKWEIKPEAETSLKKIACIIKELHKGYISIAGYTDSKGAAVYNLKLSQKRADSVKRWFIENSVIEQSNIVTKGYGEAKPVAPNTKPDGSDNPEGRDKNRRVEIKITK